MHLNADVDVDADVLNVYFVYIYFFKELYLASGHFPCNLAT